MRHVRRILSLKSLSKTAPTLSLYSPLANTVDFFGIDVIRQSSVELPSFCNKTSTLSQREGRAPQPSITFSCQAKGGPVVVGGGGPPRQRGHVHNSIRPIRLAVALGLKNDAVGCKCDAESALQTTRATLWSRIFSSPHECHWRVYFKRQVSQTACLSDAGFETQHTNKLEIGPKRPRYFAITTQMGGG